jgi:hypothetical protein
MIRALIVSLALALGLGAVAQAQWSPPAMLSAVPGGGGGGASFTGVGDARSGAFWHGGTIAYSAAQRGQQMLHLCNGGVCTDPVSDATTGIVSSTQSVNGANCDTSGHVCTAWLYDDSGFLGCASSSPCNADNGTPATPGSIIFVPNASGSVPGLKCTGTESASTGTYSAGKTQPISSGASYMVPSTPAGTQTITASGSGNILQGIDSAAKPIGYAGAGPLTASSAIATSTFVATTVTQDGSGNGSIETNNGTATTGSMGTNAFSSGGQVFLCVDAFSQHFVGTFLEVFWYPTPQLSSGDVTALVSTMRTNGGF